MIKSNLFFFIPRCEELAAGNGFQSRGISRDVFAMILEEGGEAIDKCAPLWPHLENCLSALGRITQNRDYEKARTYSEIACIILRDWAVVKNNTYAYRAAADCLKMMASDD